MVPLNDLLTRITCFLSKVYIRLFFVAFFFCCCVALPLLRIIPYYETHTFYLNEPTPELDSRHFLFQLFPYPDLSLESHHQSSFFQSITLTGFLMIFFGFITFCITLFVVFHNILFRYEIKSQLFDLINLWALFFALAHLSVFTFLITIPSSDLVHVPEVLVSSNDIYNMDLWWIYVLGILSLLIGTLTSISRFLKVQTGISRFFSPSINSDFDSSKDFQHFFLGLGLLGVFFLCCVFLPLLQLFSHDFSFKDSDYMYRSDYYRCGVWQIERFLLSIELTTLLTIVGGLCVLPFAIILFFPPKRYKHNNPVHLFHLSSMWALVFTSLHVSIFTLWSIEESKIHSIRYISPFYLEINTLNFWLWGLYVFGMCCLLLANFLVAKKEISPEGDYLSSQ